MPLERLELILVMAFKELVLVEDLRCANNTATALLAAAELILRMIITNASTDVDCFFCFCSSVDHVNFVVAVVDDDVFVDDYFPVVVFVLCIDVVGGGAYDESDASVRIPCSGRKVVSVNNQCTCNR